MYLHGKQLYQLKYNAYVQLLLPYRFHSFPKWLRSAHFPVSCLCVLSYFRLWNPMDCNPPVSSVLGILWARIQEWVAISSSKGSSHPENWSQVSCTVGRFFTIWATREALHPVQWNLFKYPCDIDSIAIVWILSWDPPDSEIIFF